MSDDLEYLDGLSAMVRMDIVCTPVDDSELRPFTGAPVVYHGTPEYALLLDIMEGEVSRTVLYCP